MSVSDLKKADTVPNSFIDNKMKTNVMSHLPLAPAQVTVLPAQGTNVPPTTHASVLPSTAPVRAALTTVHTSTVPIAPLSLTPLTPLTPVAPVPCVAPVTPVDLAPCVTSTFPPPVPQVNTSVVSNLMSGSMSEKTVDSYLNILTLQNI